MTSVAIASGAKLTLWKNWLPRLGAAFPCTDLELALEPREDHASYIAPWLKVLSADNRAVFTAVTHAQRAAEFINGKVLEATAQVNSTCAAPGQ